MSTTIFKWNPGFSSYQMGRYLIDLCDLIDEGMNDYDWSVWEHEKIHAGDRYYWLKLGYGQVGIVSSGIVSSEPYKDTDWSGKGRETYYVKFDPVVVINPDTLPILTSRELKEAIPDFDWEKGHSGLVLNDRQAAKLDELWKDFLRKHKELFVERSQKSQQEQIYWKGLIH